MTLKERIKNFKLDKYIVIETCTMVLFLASFIFLGQEFVANKFALGLSNLNFSGYETIFGTDKVVQIITQFTPEVKEHFDPHLLSFISFICFIIGGVLQLVCIVLRHLKKPHYTAIAITNLISSILIIFCGVVIFFSEPLFNIANKHLEYVKFSGINIYTSAWTILMCGIISILNSSDLVIKNFKKQ